MPRTTMSGAGRPSRVHDSGVTRPCGALLDAVVADGCRGVERLVDVLAREVLDEPVSSARPTQSPA